MDGVFFLGFLLILFLIFAAIGKYHPVSGAEVLDWKPTRSPEVEAELELDDIDQMLEAQNERRRRSGRPELTEDEVRAQVDAEQREDGVGQPRGGGGHRPVTRCPAR